MTGTLSSNLTGLAIAEETSLKTLPVTPVWYAYEPNTYSNLGGKLTLVARNTINASRQLYKGVTTDLVASGGFNIDFTQTNLQRLMQGFFFADAHEKQDTQSFNSTAVVLTGANGSTHQFTAASGLASFLVNSLVESTGFNTAANNTVSKITTVAAGALTTTGLTTEASPPATARLETVGYQFAADDLSITFSGGTCTITTVVADLTTLSLNVGEWIFLGGDSSTLRLANNQGYGRIASIAAHAMVLDKTTWTPVTEASSGSKTVQMYFGKFIRNELATNLIKRRTYQLERQLGADGVGMMSEYITGAVPDQLVVNIKQASKMDADLSFVACDSEQRNGTTGVKSGTRVSSLGEVAINTSSDVYRMRLNIIDPANPAAASLFAYVSDIKMTLKNNVKETKAVAVLGAFDTTAGNFEFTGTVTAYFNTTDAVAAVRNNSDVSLDVIIAQHNQGFVIDTPLLALGNGMLNIVKDAPIDVPLDTNAARNSAGYTASMTFFNYLPNLAMPT